MHSLGGSFANSSMVLLEVLSTALVARRAACQRIETGINNMLPEKDTLFCTGKSRHVHSRNMHLRRKKGESLLIEETAIKASTCLRRYDPSLKIDLEQE